MLVLVISYQKLIMKIKKKIIRKNTAKYNDTN